MDNSASLWKTPGKHFYAHPPDMGGGCLTGADVFWGEKLSDSIHTYPQPAVDNEPGPAAADVGLRPGWEGRVWGRRTGSGGVIHISTAPTETTIPGIYFQLGIMRQSTPASGRSALWKTLAGGIALHKAGRLRTAGGWGRSAAAAGGRESR